MQQAQAQSKEESQALHGVIQSLHQVGCYGNQVSVSCVSCVSSIKYLRGLFWALEAGPPPATMLTLLASPQSAEAVAVTLLE
jgi:hypothetical protein